MPTRTASFFKYDNHLADLTTFYFSQHPYRVTTSLFHSTARKCVAGRRSSENCLTAMTTAISPPTPSRRAHVADKSQSKKPRNGAAGSFNRIQTIICSSAYPPAHAYFEYSLDWMRRIRLTRYSVACIPTQSLPREESLPRRKQT